MLNNKPRAAPKSSRLAWSDLEGPGELLLPGALLVTMQTQLLAPFMFVDFRLAALFQ